MTGSADVRVSLGTAQLGSAYGIANQGMPAPEQADAVFAAAFDAGVRDVDTAPEYGEAERRFGAFLRANRAPPGLRVGSKLPAVGPRPAADLRALVGAAVDASLARLGVERLDPYLIHDALDLRHHGDELVGALVEQQQRGVVGRLGVSVYGPGAAELVLRYGELTVVQHPVNLLDRRLVASGVLPRLTAAGVEVHARSVFLQGLLQLSPERLPAAVAHARPYLVELQRLLERRGATAPAVALPWVASIHGIERIVLGVLTPQQLAENLAALERPVPAGLGEALATELLPAPPEVLDPTRWERSG